MLYNDVLNHNNRKNWCSLIKKLLCDLGFVDVWLFQTIGNVDLFLYNVKQRINDQFMQNWNFRLNESSRAVFYKSIASFRFQPYLNICSIKKVRVAFSRLRMSSHKLLVETGRWQQPVIQFDNRKCTSCDILEDEFHFILQCNMYDNLRKQYIPPYYWRHPNMLKLIELVNSENECTVKRLTCFIEKAFNLRNDLLTVRRN